MNASPKAPTPQQMILTMWVVWFGILSGLFAIAAIAAPESVAPDEAVRSSLSPLGMVGIAAVVAGLTTRFLLLPRLSGLQAKLPAMVVGLALCEGAGFIGMFAVSAEQGSERTLLFSLAVAGVLASAPIYARPGKPQSGHDPQ